MTYFPYRRYVRNYPVSGVASLDFDCISEFEMDLDPSIRDIAHSGSRKKMVEDERRFMKPECIRFATVREQILLDAEKEAASGEGASSGEESSPGSENLPNGEQRHLLLFRRGERAPEDFEQDLDAAARALVKASPALRRCSLDLVSQIPGQSFPFDALMWLTLQTEGASVSAFKALPGCVSVAVVQTCASQKNTMDARFDGYIP